MDDMLDIVEDEDYGKATVVSIVPFKIQEHIPGLIPSYFTIEAAPIGKIEVLVVGKVLHHVYVDHSRGYLTLRYNPVEVARALCRDYVEAQMVRDEEAHPGIFPLRGEFKAEEIEKKYPQKLARARQVQNAWFQRLVLMGDDYWQTYHMHKFIPELMRYAARSLGLERDWLYVPQQELMASQTKCLACKATIPVDAIVCQFCTVVQKPEEFKKLQFAKPA